MYGGNNSGSFSIYKPLLYTTIMLLHTTPRIVYRQLGSSTTVSQSVFLFKNG